MENKESKILRSHLQVSALKEGTVIDHIPADMLFTVINILKLDQYDNMITFGTNLESSRLGKKAIIKIENLFFDESDYNKISLVAPHARINEINNYEVVRKTNVTIPKEVKDIVQCFNPVCITNKQPIKTRFYVIGGSRISLKCHYCEKETQQSDFVFIK